METWKSIPGANPRYQVSDLGNVRNTDTGEALRPWLRSGYPTVNLRDGPQRKLRSVHVIVLEAFVGPRPAGLHAAHLDGNRGNASLVNLKWVGAAENEAHKKQHGSHSKGRALTRRQFTDRQVQILREIASLGVAQTRLAELLGVPDSTVSLILKQQSYA